MGACRSLAIAVVVLCGCGDNIHPGGGTLMVSPQLDLHTTELGGTATFTVALTNQPLEKVTIEITSMDTTEGTVSPATLSFDRDNFADARTVTVTGVDDDRADGDQSYLVRVGSDELGAVDLDITNDDDDVAGFEVSPVVGLETSESGATAMFSVMLTSQPAADVMVPVTSSDPTEGVTDRASLVFTDTNWFSPQTVTVTGQPDLISDGNVSYTIMLGAASSSDNGYEGLDPDDVTLMNVDENVGGISVSAPATLMTTEGGGQATFSVVLMTQPMADVTIPIASTDTGEASVSTASLVFTAANWNVAQTVTVTGVDDSIIDGPQPFTITLGPATSTDTSYAGLDPNDLAGVNADNDSASITVQPTSGLVTSEAGTTATFGIVLGSQPAANVTIAVMSSDASEASVSTTQVTFTSANWSTVQTVTVTGVDDVIDDGDQPFTILLAPAASGDPAYSGIDPDDPTGTNTDNDTSAIVVTPTSGLVTSEAGGADSFTVVLTSQPSGNVTIPVASNDTTEGTVSPTSITFTPANWNVARTVTVTGVNDILADGTQTYTIVLSPATSSDTLYNGINPADVTVQNLDNDIASVTVDPINGLVVSEFQDTDTFTIVLDTQPIANVTISLMSSDTTEGTVLPASVTFTPANWNQPRTITVTGVDDTLNDGNQNFTIITGNAVSLDPRYSGIAVANVDVTNIDNDIAQVYVKARRRLLVSENGQSATFRVRLTIPPTAQVTCTLQSTDLTEGLVSPTTLNFTPGNFGFQTVTVSGVDDTMVDGDVTFTVQLNACTSTDNAYNGSNPRDVTAVNRDND
ncbi:MAG TPA: Calx-beta domain-containing protein [Kofleriaceae bacterium]|nr:Calx-beta domain-containing protein [Kofleriaceae bacterium]